MRYTAVRRGSGFSGKVILFLITITATSGGFLLGYFVGKSMNTPSVTQSPVPKQTMSITTVPPKEIAQTVEKNVSSEPTPQKPGSPPIPVQSSPAPHASVIRDHEQKAPPMPSPGVNEKATPPRGTKNAGDEGAAYTVQVGAFKNQKEADSLRVKLDSKGYKVYTKKGTLKKATVFKVMVGEFARKKEAEVFALKLRNAERLNAYVTVMN
jgi:DedD protein